VPVGMKYGMPCPACLACQRLRFCNIWHVFLFFPRPHSNAQRPHQHSQSSKMADGAIPSDEEKDLQALNTRLHKYYISILLYISKLGYAASITKVTVPMGKSLWKECWLFKLKHVGTPSCEIIDLWLVKLRAYGETHPEFRNIFVDSVSSEDAPVTPEGQIGASRGTYLFKLITIEIFSDYNGADGKDSRWSGYHRGSLKQASSGRYNAKHIACGKVQDGRPESFATHVKACSSTSATDRESYAKGVNLRSGYSAGSVNHLSVASKSSSVQVVNKNQPSAASFFRPNPELDIKARELLGKALALSGTTSFRCVFFIPSYIL
jgi:hypothetical protein